MGLAEPRSARGASARPLLSLYRLDRRELEALARRLRSALAEDDRGALSSLLGLGEELAARVAEAPSAVGLMLLPESDGAAAPLFASLRRIARRAALEHVWTSASPALEGRLRAYDVLRDEPDVARHLDRLLDGARVPWFLRRRGATAGWLDDGERALLAEALAALGPSLPDEVNAFAEALGGIDGEVLVHDRLA